jgi:hypothetical protein
MIEEPPGRIDYDECGAGPTIVLVPGSCSTGAAWRPVMATWNGQFRCLTILIFRMRPRYWNRSFAKPVAVRRSTVPPYPRRLVVIYPDPRDLWRSKSSGCATRQCAAERVYEQCDAYHDRHSRAFHDYDTPRRGGSLDWSARASGRTGVQCRRSSPRSRGYWHISSHYLIFDYSPKSCGLQRARGKDEFGRFPNRR